MKTLLDLFRARQSFPTARRRHSSFVRRRRLTVQRLEERSMMAAGMLDAGFGTGGLVTTNIGPNIYYTSSESVIQPDDGKLLVAGVSASGGRTVFVVARYNSDGSLDDGGPQDASPLDDFGDGGKVILGFGSLNLEGPSIALQNEKIVLAGTISNPMTGDYNIFVTRYNADGSLDQSFGDGGVAISDLGGNESVSHVAIQADDKILVAGWNYLNGGDIFLARYAADGALDSGFHGDGWTTIDFGGGGDTAFTVVVQDDGRIVLGGAGGYGINDDQAEIVLARLNEDGDLDTNFGNGGRVITDLGGDEGIVGLAVQPDGKIVAAGWFGTGGAEDLLVVRYNDNGALDTSFSGDGWLATDFNGSYAYANSVALQVDGKIVVAGYGGASGAAGFALARYDAAGNLDTSFDQDGLLLTATFGGQNNNATGVLVQDDGMIVVSGSMYDPGSSTGRFAFARYHAYDLSIGGTKFNDTITVDRGTQAGTLQVTINGESHDNLLVDGEAFVYGLGGDDIITINASLSGGLIVAGQGGADSCTVNFGLLAGPVRVADDGASGTDVLTVRGTPRDDSIFKDATTVQLLRPAETVYMSGIERRIIRGGGGDDLIIDPGSDTTLYGDEGNDTLVVTATEGSGVTMDGGDGSDSYVIFTGELNGPVVIDDSGATGVDSATIQGGDGDDSIVQNATGLLVNQETIILDATIETLAVDGGGGTCPSGKAV